MKISASLLTLFVSLFLFNGLAHAEATPCEWAKANQKAAPGTKYVLTTDDGVKINVVLDSVRRIDLGGGYVGYTYAFEAKGGTKASDNIYMINGGPDGFTHLFFVANPIPSATYFMATITCKEG